MEMIDITLKMVETVGFPVFVAIALLYQNNQTAKYYQEIFIKFRDTIEENTKTMQAILKELKQ